MPPAIEPGKDFDGTPTPYDASGIFTGSVTVVDGTPVATCTYERFISETELYFQSNSINRRTEFVHF